jgi:hypothetical protein
MKIKMLPVGLVTWKNPSNVIVASWTTSEFEMFYIRVAFINA